MATGSANPSSSPPLPEAPCHRSPPRYPDFYGKHRKQVELQILNREIGFLKEELQSVGDLKPASSCCKEVDEFVGTNPDPLIPQNLKIRRPFRIWKWLCGKSCFNASWICCSSGCLPHLERPCCACDPSRNCQCCCRRSGCCLEKPCCRSCCLLSSLSCSDCSCRCVWSCVGCRKGDASLLSYLWIGNSIKFLEKRGFAPKLQCILEKFSLLLEICFSYLKFIYGGPLTYHSLLQIADDDQIISHV